MKFITILLLFAVALTGCGGGSSVEVLPSGNGQSARALPPFLQPKEGLLPTQPVATLPMPEPPPVEPAQPAAQPFAASTPAQEAAPTAAPEPETPALDSGCLIGTWAVANLSSAMIETMNQEQASLSLQGLSGQVLYQFSPDGGLSITFDNLAVAMEGTVEGQPVAVVNALHGSGTARYAVDALRSEIALSEFGGEGIQSVLEINGQTLMETSLPVWSAFTSGGVVQGKPDAPGTPEEAHGAVEISRAAAICAGDQLILRAVEPVPGPEVQLERVP